MSKASVLVDAGVGQDRATVTTTVTDFSSLALAQDYSALLSAEWADEGWKKRHEVWVRGGAWRQKLVIVGGAE